MAAKKTRALFVNRFTRAQLLAAALVSAVGAAPHAHAVDLFWDGEVSNIWLGFTFVPNSGLITNWSPDALPGAADTVIFDRGTPVDARYTVNLPLSTTNDTFAVRNDAVELVIPDGVTYTSIDEFGSVFIGDNTGEVGDLRLTGGGTFTSDLGQVGLSGGMGTVTVDANTTWLSNGGLAIGNGAVDVLPGGAIDVADGVLISGGTNAAGVMTVSGVGASVDAGVAVVVGFQTTGTLRIEGGAQFQTVDANIGTRQTVNTQGTITVTDAGSRLTVTDELALGSPGTGGVGLVNLFDGGQADVTGPISIRNQSALTILDGTLNAASSISVQNGRFSYVSGTFNLRAGQALTLEQESVGLLAVETVFDGGKSLTADSGSILNVFAPLTIGGSSAGTATFGDTDGLQAVINASELVTVGSQGVLNLHGGRLNAQAGVLVDGGAVDFDNASFQFMPPTRLTLGDGQAFVAQNNASLTGSFIIDDGNHFELQSGSTWVNPGLVVVGETSTGSLTFDSNSQGDFNALWIGINPGSQGTVTVADGAHITTLSTLRVGIEGANLPDPNGGVATLNVNTGGTVIAGTFGPSEFLNIGNQGTVNLNGGTIHTRRVKVQGGTFNFTAGTLNVGTFEGTLNQSAGTLAPGSSPGSSPSDAPGTTTITGDANLAGTVAIELGGVIAGTEHDRLVVAGALNLGPASVLDVTLIDAFVPAEGDTFDLFDFASLTGTFGTVSLPALGSGLYWDTSDLYADGSLRVVDTLLGDLNGDGSLTNADIDAFVQALTDPNAYASAYPTLDADTLGDFNGDGALTNGDVGGFVETLSNLGVDTSAVPEPTSVALLALGGLIAMRRRR